MRLWSQRTALSLISALVPFTNTYRLGLFAQSQEGLCPVLNGAVERQTMETDRTHHMLYSKKTDRQIFIFLLMMLLLIHLFGYFSFTKLCFLRSHKFDRAPVCALCCIHIFSTQLMISRLPQIWTRYTQGRQLLASSKTVAPYDSFCH